MGLVFWALKVWLYYISHLAIAKEASDTQKLGCMASWHILKPYQIVKLSAMPQKKLCKKTAAKYWSTCSQSEVDFWCTENHV